jgi:hypothetical protein
MDQAKQFDDAKESLRSWDKIRRLMHWEILVFPMVCIGKTMAFSRETHMPFAKRSRH